MDIETVHKELTRRIYWWVLDEAEREARSNYPLLRGITNVGPNTGVACFLSVADTLEANQRVSLSRALVKSGYFETLKIVNAEDILHDSFLPEERQLALGYRETCRLWLGERPPRRQGDCTPTVSRRLPRIVTQHLSSVLQTKFVRDEPSVWRSSLLVEDWEILTDIQFTRTGISCEYWIVRSDNEKADNVGAFDDYTASISRYANFDFVRSLGVSAALWVVDCEQDIEACLSSMSLVCTKVLTHLPLLLQGLGIAD